MCAVKILAAPRAAESLDEQVSSFRRVLQKALEELKESNLEPKGLYTNSFVVLAFKTSNSYWKNVSVIKHFRIAISVWKTAREKAPPLARHCGQALQIDFHPRLTAPAAYSRHLF